MFHRQLVRDGGRRVDDETGVEEMAERGGACKTSVKEKLRKDCLGACVWLP